MCQVSDSRGHYNVHPLLIIILLEHLCDVSVVGDRLFPISGGGPQLLEWEECGFKIHVPEGAMSGPCNIAVMTIVAGQFDFPKGTELVSAVYAISTSKKLNKPVTVEIQHCVAITNVKQGQRLEFVRADCKQQVLPYHFKPIEGGRFSPRSSYGTISCKHFSLLGITLRVPANGSRGIQIQLLFFAHVLQCMVVIQLTNFLYTDDVPLMEYFAQAYYMSRARNSWTMEFAVTKHLNPSDLVRNLQ